MLVGLGFDEEIGGRKGAGHIGKFLEDKYGQNSIAAIVDEGSGAHVQWGTTFISPGVTEKGFINVQVEVRARGGHSSVPDTHTGIGIMSHLIKKIEDNPYNTYISEGHPVMDHLKCGRKWASNFNTSLSDELRKRLESKQGTTPDNDVLAKMYESQNPEANHLAKWVTTTSQAVTLINGGIKINALPESTIMKMNHRIHINESPEFVEEKLEAIAQGIAVTHGFKVVGFKTTDGNLSYVAPPTSITLTRLTGLIPAPISTTALMEGSRKTAYAVLVGSIKRVFNDIISPAMNAGNTDTRHYWNLTPNIYRYIPGASTKDSANLHTTDEGMTVSHHLQAIDWYQGFIRNMDATLLPGDGK